MAPTHARLLVQPMFGIFFIERTGQNRTRLTDLGSQIPPTLARPYGSCLPKSIHWSIPLSRIYYAASCNEGEREFLFSVGIGGDNRLEADLPSLYPDDRFTFIKNVLPSAIEGVVYITVTAEQSPPGRSRIINHWRVLRIDGPGNVEVIFALTPPISNY